MLKKFSVLAACLFLSFLLTGCNQDEKQAVNIYHQLEKSAKLEKAFAVKQEKLQQTNKKEQDLYNKILKFNIVDEEKITNGIDSAKAENNKQNKLLKKAKQDFNTAYKKLTPVQEYIDDIKDKEQKKAASKVMKLANQRNEQLQAYYQCYASTIKLNDQLYDDMLKNDFSAKKLDKQIKKLNKNYQDMKDDASAFNKATKAYNNAKSSYYRLADLDTKKLKQAQT